MEKSIILRRNQIVKRSMKYLLILILLLPLCSKADEWVAQDKAKHVVVSSVLMVGTVEFCKAVEVKNPYIMGGVMTLSVGLAKEFMIDQKPSGKDIAADVVGIALGYALNRLIFKRWRH